MFFIWGAVSLTCALVGAASAAGTCSVAAPYQHLESGLPCDDPVSLLQTSFSVQAANAPAVGAPGAGVAADSEWSPESDLPGVQVQSRLGSYMPVPHAELRQEGSRRQHLATAEEDQAAMQELRDLEEKLRHVEEGLEKRGLSSEATDEAEVNASTLIEQLYGVQGQQQEQDEGLGLTEQGRQYRGQQDYQKGNELADEGTARAGAHAAPSDATLASELRQLTRMQQGQQQQDDQQTWGGQQYRGGFEGGESDLPVTTRSQKIEDINDATEDCAPQCRWQCNDPKCDEVCRPVCAAPKCETRCGTPDISACTMDCTKAQCAVVCPKAKCPKANCAHCSTVCSEPLCKLRCPGAQPCRNVCEEPACEWDCSAPKDCPAPQCSMVCEHPKNCLGNTHKALPDLAPGEVKVGAFCAENKTAMLTLLGLDGQLHNHEVPLRPSQGF